MLRAAAGIRDFPAGFASMMQRYEKFLNYASFFPFFFEKVHKGDASFCVYSPPTVSKRLPCCPRKPFLLTKMAARCNQEGRRG